MTVGRAAIGLVAIGLAALAPACFHPSYEHVACGPDDTCPGGMSCDMTSGFCERPGGGPIADASTGDAIGPGAPDSGAVRICLGRSSTCAPTCLGEHSA